MREPVFTDGGRPPVFEEADQVLGGGSGRRVGDARAVRRDLAAQDDGTRFWSGDAPA